MPLKPGDKVIIYQHPYSKTKPEGTATLLEKESTGPDGREQWLVQFEDEADTYSRSIYPQKAEGGQTMPITMSKAIEILDLNMKEAHKTMPADVKDALNLAINTMGTVVFMRKGGQWAINALFPGELPAPEK